MKFALGFLASYEIAILLTFQYKGEKFFGRSFAALWSFVQKVKICASSNKGINNSILQFQFQHVSLQLHTQVAPVSITSFQCALSNFIYIILKVTPSRFANA